MGVGVCEWVFMSVSVCLPASVCLSVCLSACHTVIINNTVYLGAPFQNKTSSRHVTDIYNRYIKHGDYAAAVEPYQVRRPKFPKRDNKV